MGTIERREREREERQRRILDAARAVFQARSIEAATMEEVAERAELSKGALYLYFASKDDLVTALLLAPLDDLVERFERELEGSGDGAGCVERMLRLQARSLREHREVFRLVFGARCAHAARPEGATHLALMRERRGRLLALYGAAITRGQRDGSIRAGVRPGVVAVQMWASLLGLGILGAQEATLGLELDDVAADLVDLFGHALRSGASSVVADGVTSSAQGRTSRPRRSRRA